MNKQIYERPELEIIKVKIEDIIAASDIGIAPEEDELQERII